MKMKFNSSNFAIALVLVTVALAYFDVSSAVDLIKPIKEDAFCKKSRFFAANGSQIRDKKTCVSLEIGEIPDVNHMVSALIIEPRNNQRIKRNKNFTVTMKVDNLLAGFFSDAANDYYQIPQTLNKNGKIQGHSHITIQQLDGNTVPDPTVFAFFKGLNDPLTNGNELSVVVANGLAKPGLYRICTMNAANSHQPVVMPVAQRGAQDDCIRINIV